MYALCLCEIISTCPWYTA